MATKFTLTRPKDESFESYKTWILSLVEKMGAENDLTEKQLREGHKKFWAKAKAKGSKKG